MGGDRPIPAILAIQTCCPGTTPPFIEPEQSLSARIHCQWSWWSYPNAGSLSFTEFPKSPVSMKTSKSSAMPGTTYDRIYRVVARIPSGTIATYGQVADLAGLGGKARLVGYALFRIPIPADVPWHRVINAQGEISYSLTREGGDYLQRSLLEDEGIVFTKQGKIDLKTYRWQPTRFGAESELEVGPEVGPELQPESELESETEMLG
jgi:methylated-DNA-protein-cysteine methyltransferase related protein